MGKMRNDSDEKTLLPCNTGDSLGQQAWEEQIRDHKLQALRRFEDGDPALTAADLMLVAEMGQAAAESLRALVGRPSLPEVSATSRWSRYPVEDLVDEVDKQSTPKAKGEVLEALMCKVIQFVPGFRVHRTRVRTKTEEIDIEVINGSDDPVWRREGALLLVECKNWSKKCGKNEFVVFKEQLRNRKLRCTCGFLIAWNGFAGTVSREMLRGSAEELLVIPVAGPEIACAVRARDIPGLLRRAWDGALML
ncbi:MAG: hypothetical protein JSU86_03305 [Phycisphaerales bacterium]|nr:MAG: hypothetical protein JSU86_03305 [Phycisphaerales bacterium]